MADTETTAGDEVVDTPVAGEQAAVSGGDGATPAAPSGTQNLDVVSSRGYRLSQRLFVLAGLCLVLFTVYETFSNQPAVEPALLPLAFDAVQARVVQGDAALSDTIDMYERRRIFGPPPPDQPGPEDETAIVRGWRAEVRKNWDLKGTSAVPGTQDEGILEAIVFDNRVQGLQFLRAGQTVQIAEQEVDVSRIEADRIELRRGDEVLVLD